MSTTPEDLPKNLRRFAEARAAGLPLADAARAGGSGGKTLNALKVTASRWEARTDVASAIAVLKERFASSLADADESSLEGLATRALKEVLLQKVNPTARIKAAELILKMLGRLKQQHVHAHAHLHADAPRLEAGEERRLLRIALRGRTVRCPGCGSEVPLDVVAEGSVGAGFSGEDFAL